MNLRQAIDNMNQAIATLDKFREAKAKYLADRDNANTNLAAVQPQLDQAKAAFDQAKLDLQAVLSQP